MVIGPYFPAGGRSYPPATSAPPPRHPSASARRPPGRSHPTPGPSHVGHPVEYTGPATRPGSRAAHATAYRPPADSPMTTNCPTPRWPGKSGDINRPLTHPTGLRRGAAVAGTVSRHDTNPRTHELVVIPNEIKPTRRGTVEVHHDRAGRLPQTRVHEHPPIDEHHHSVTHRGPPVHGLSAARAPLEAMVPIWTPSARMHPPSRELRTALRGPRSHPGTPDLGPDCGSKERPGQDPPWWGNQPAACPCALVLRRHLRHFGQGQEDRGGAQRGQGARRAGWVRRRPEQRLWRVGAATGDDSPRRRLVTRRASWL